MLIAAAKHLVGDSMHADDWMDEPETSRSRILGGDSSQEDDNVDMSVHDDDDEENSEDEDEEMDDIVEMTRGMLQAGPSNSDSKPLDDL